MHARARRHTLMLLDTLFIFTVYWNFPCTYLSTGGLQSHTLKHFFLIQLYHQMEWSAKRTFINRSTNQSIHLKKNRKRKKRESERERERQGKKEARINPDLWSIESTLIHWNFSPTECAYWTLFVVANTLEAKLNGWFHSTGTYVFLEPETE